MADNTSVSIGFKTKEAQQEIRALTNEMKQTQNQFKVTDATLKTTGSTLDQLGNKYKSLETQLKLQHEITTKCEQGVKKYAQSQESARQRLEKATAAYEKGKTELKGNSEELQKLKNEVDKAQKAVTSAEASYTKWNNKLSQSKVAEANLRNELSQTSSELQKQSRYIAQVQAEYAKLQDKTAGVRKGMTATGKALTAGVTAPIVAVAGYAVKSMNDVDEGLDTVMTKTGATGKEAEALKDVYMDVAKTVPGAYGDIGAAVGEINTRLGFTGETLRVASNDFLKFAKINKTDVNSAVELVTRAMGDASIPASEYKTVLDYLTVASQKSGISIDTLAQNLAKYGAPMRALGLDVQNSIALFAAWEKAGVNTEIAFSGMKKAISTWGTEGKDSRVEFQKTLEAIKSAPDLASATTKAIEVFGSKAGPDLADAIKGGRFEVTEYINALSNAGGAVDNTYGMIVDEVDDAQLAIQNIQVSLHGLGETIAKTAGPSVLDAVENVTEWIEKFDELDEAEQKNILKLGLFLASLGPVISIGAKGISVVNGGIAAVKKLSTIFSGATTAASAVATATTATGEAVTVAGGAAATAAGGSGVGAFLAALGSVATVSAGVTAVVSLPFIAVTGVAALAEKAIEDYHDELINSGNEALSQAQNYSSKTKEAYDMSAEAKTVEEYYNRYKELTDLQSSGTSTADSEKERKAIEQWFIDNYGDYISAEEQKNGIHQETLDYINQIIEAQERRAEAEKKAAAAEVAENSGERREAAQSSAEELPKAQQTKSSYENKIKEAELLKINLETLKAEYAAIDKTDTEAVQNLINNNQALFDSYSKLTGGQLTLPGLDGSIENLSDCTKEWSEQVIANDKLIKGHEQSIAAYKESLIVLQDTVTEDALSKSGYNSIFDLFSSGDTVAIDNAISSVEAKCQSLGMTTTETALQVSLFKNGFSNLNEALASGDKGMKAVVDNLNNYMHTVGGLPENYTLSINAAGDISIIDTAQEGITQLDNTSAEVQIKVDEGDSQQQVMTLQELIDTYGATKAVSMLRADDQATVTINGVSYRLLEYDSATGMAVLKADGSEAAITINTATGQVNSFDDEEGTAKLKVDGSSVSSGLEAAKRFVKQSWTSFTASLNLMNFAEGTSSAPEGPAVINDENTADPRELVKHKGKYYLFNGRNVLVNLSKGDSVYTAAQTKRMLAKLPHYATGTNNNTSFDNAKSDFEYLQKTSIVTDEEALIWWKNILEEYASDADVVREANIEIYELTNKINDDAIKDYKNRIKNQESASKDWIDYEVKMHNLSIDEQIAAYGRMDENYLNTLLEMIQNTDMTAEELEEVWGDYYDTIRDHEIKVADLRKKNLDDMNKQSLNYISERTYYNDWEQYGDTPEEAYERIRQRNMEALLNNDITNDEFNGIMTDAGQQIYEGQLANSKRWLENQRKYGNISEEEYRAGLMRIKDYTEKYYQAGLISGQYYYDAMDDANSELFDNMSTTLEDYVNEYYEAQNRMLDEKRAAIEAEYAAIEDAETKAEREEEMEDLQAQYDKYKNAVTIEGKKKLQEIEERMDALRKEESDEAREAEKQARLDALDEESELLAKEQENTLKGLDKYTAQALGIISGGNDEMTAKFNAVVSAYNAQQERLAQSGYDTISKIVDQTNLKLLEIGRGLGVPSSATENKYTVTITQSFENNITDEATAKVYGKYAGEQARKSIESGFVGIDTD